MIDLFHAELLKLRTTRTFIALTGIGVVTSLVIAVLVSILTEPTRGDRAHRRVRGGHEQLLHPRARGDRHHR